MAERAERVEQEEIFSQVLRAGRRTYFFDVRATKADDYYLTVTESKKFTHDDGSFHYQKHKIYLYKEDFTDFKEMLGKATDYILNEKGSEVISERHQKDFKKEDTPTIGDNKTTDSFTDVSFDDI
ncbi:PUR family DNA/RNA-binding protein [Polaribacter sp. Asnod1-A03]|uniref:PUR family DNA/RNA-binding protein n=1 Tax=Polaribacter sp. Asnod1-A03 TaxID=3160581 RepID=UPI00387083AC